MTRLLQADEVQIRHDGQVILEPVGFELSAGQCLVVLGESGSGKSLLAQAIMGLLPDDLNASGTVTIAGTASPAQDQLQRRRAWGHQIALLPQEPWRSLNPTMMIGAQVAEVHTLVGGLRRSAARSRAQSALERAGLAGEYDALPHRLSGGMAQRATLAAARAGGAPILVADEPTKGLDATLRTRVVEDLRSVCEEGGAVFVITHDVHVARMLADELLVMRKGQVVERGPAALLFASPSTDYTRELLAADPATWPSTANADVKRLPLLQATGLGKGYGAKSLFRNLDLTLMRSERLALCGPSGSGKSTLGDILIGLRRAEQGTVERAGGLAQTAFQKLHQDPGAAFPPTLTLAQALGDVVTLHQGDWSSVRADMQRLGLDESLLRRRPAALSSGELQRFAILRALLAKPALIFADEPTSRLDPISQMRALRLLDDVARERRIALLLVTHDPDVARFMTSRPITLPLAQIKAPA